MLCVYTYTYRHSPYHVIPSQSTLLEESRAQTGNSDLGRIPYQYLPPCLLILTTTSISTPIAPSRKKRHLLPGHIRQVSAYNYGIHDFISR